MRKVRIVYLCMLLVACLFSRASIASVELLKLCEPLRPPFDQIHQSVQQVEVSWIVKGVLCYKATQANWLVDKGEKEQAIQSLESFMHVTIALMPKHIDKPDADRLIESARAAIEILSYVPPSLTGAVFTYDSKPRVGAEVNILFSRTGNLYSAITDEEGFFVIEAVEAGGFVARATSLEGEVGSAHEGVVEKSEKNSVIIYVEPPGEANIYGKVYVDGQVTGGDIMVFARFPELSKAYATTVDPDGSFRFENIAAKGSFTLSGVHSSTLAVGIEFDYVPHDTLEADVDLYLDTPRVVNTEFLNPSFENGLENWEHSGNVKLVPTEEYFGE